MTVLEPPDLSLYDTFDLLDLDEYDIDLKPFLHELYIVEKNLGVSKLADVIHPAQDYLFDYVSQCINEQRECRVIVLKARQIGISTAIEGLAFTFSFLMERLRAMIVSHEATSSEHLLSMSQTYFDEFFANCAYTQKNKSAKVLSWLETRSQIAISTAKNTKAGRSKTLQFLHGSEVAFWDNADVLMTGLANSVTDGPLSFIFMESTANGIGNYFHTQWEEACRGESDYMPMFFPWWTHPEYLASKKFLPPVNGGYDEEERKLIRLFKNPPRERWNNYTQEPLSDAEIADRLAWRRWAWKNRCRSSWDTFHQEYPSTPDEAFISTGTNIFPLDKLDAVFDFWNGGVGDIIREGDRIRFQPNQEGHTRIFKTPVKGAEYVVAGDPKRATEGDFAAIQVLNRRTWEQVAVYREKVDPITFGEVMMNFGVYYNTALLAPEIEGGGYATIGVIQARNYPKVFQHQKAEAMPGQVDNWYGWHTNWKTKNQAVGTLKKVVVDKLITLHDRQTYNEMKNYVSLPGGKFGNGELVDHDDLVMALGIGITVILYTQFEIPSLEIQDIVQQGQQQRPIHVSNALPEEMPGGPSRPPVSQQPTQAAIPDVPSDVPQEPPWMSWGEEEVT